MRFKLWESVQVMLGALSDHHDDLSWGVALDALEESGVDVERVFVMRLKHSVEGLYEPLRRVRSRVVDVNSEMIAVGRVRAGNCVQLWNGLSEVMRGHMREPFLALYLRVVRVVMAGAIECAHGLGNDRVIRRYIRACERVMGAEAGDLWEVVRTEYWGPRNGVHWEYRDRGVAALMPITRFWGVAGLGFWGEA